MASSQFYVSLNIKIGHLSDGLPSQSLTTVLKKLNWKPIGPILMNLESESCYYMQSDQ